MANQYPVKYSQKLVSQIKQAVSQGQSLDIIIELTGATPTGIIQKLRKLSKIYPRDFPQEKITEYGRQYYQTEEGQHYKSEDKKRVSERKQQNKEIGEYLFDMVVLALDKNSCTLEQLRMYFKKFLGISTGNARILSEIKKYDEEQEIIERANGMISIKRDAQGNYDSWTKMYIEFLKNRTAAKHPETGYTVDRKVLNNFLDFLDRENGKV